MTSHKYFAYIAKMCVTMHKIRCISKCSTNVWTFMFTNNVEFNYMYCLLWNGIRNWSWRELIYKMHNQLYRTRRSSIVCILELMNKISAFVFTVFLKAIKTNAVILFLFLHSIFHTSVRKQSSTNGCVHPLFVSRTNWLWLERHRRKIAEKNGDREAKMKEKRVQMKAWVIVFHYTLHGIWLLLLLF